MKNFKITFYACILDEETTGVLFIQNTTEATARKYAKETCDKFDWFYSIEEIN